MFSFTKHQVAVPVVNLENMEVMLDRIFQSHLAIYDKPSTQRSKLKAMEQFWIEVHRDTRRRKQRDVNITFQLPTYAQEVGEERDNLKLVMFLNIDLAMLFGGKMIAKIDRKLNELGEDNE